MFYAPWCIVKIKEKNIEKLIKIKSKNEENNIMKRIKIKKKYREANQDKIKEQRREYYSKIRIIY
jgi:hypothetical protein